MQGRALFTGDARSADKSIAADGRAVRLSPGIDLTAEIKTDRTRVIEFLLVVRATRESLT
jgi:hemolysin D